ncbi:MAG TPA: S8/S53 family peptidase [Polyangiaceae bacterium]|nr:S8/S53 family peptidase [Polyangiaceae bacterium]
MQRFHSYGCLLVAPCALLLGCSGQSDADGETAALTRAAILAPVPIKPTVTAPSTAVLGSTFTASVTPYLAGSLSSYHWGGEGVSVISEGASSATLSCTWPGFHTIEASVGSAAPLTAQIYCSSPLCDGKPCPGVKVLPKEALDCPQTDVLIRVNENESCPETTPGWVGGPLIKTPHVSDDSGAPGTNDAKKPALFTPLDRFCSYSWNGRPEQFADHPPPAPHSQRSSDLVWDCPRIAAHTTPTTVEPLLEPVRTTDGLNAVLAARGRAELGSIEWTPPMATPPATPATPTSPATTATPIITPATPATVTIAVVDTAASSWSDPDNNPHGKAVGVLARDTACGDQTNCGVQLKNYLGMPLRREPISTGGAFIRRDVQHGGSFGAHAHLVRAIVAAVDEERDEANAQQRDPRLVLNLSLAYESELPSTLVPAADDFENRVVLEALYYARCNGALILAAAGNGPVPAKAGQLPGLPARWTGLPALDQTECNKRFGVARFSAGTGPLVYAVSGLDFAAQPLLTTRGAGQSTIAALGYMAVREDPGGGYTRRLTGTSISTATLSGIVASVWSHALLNPDLIMDALYAKGVPTSIASDFAPFGKSSTPVHRITRCTIADAFPGLASCVADPPTPDAALPPGTLPELPEGPEQPPFESVSAAVSPWKYPWIEPQPSGEPVCGACSLGSRTLSLALRLSSLNSVNYMRLLARKAAGASFTGGYASRDDGEDLLIADIPNLQTDPFSVPLDDSFTDIVSAELSYQIMVDRTPVDETESVLIQDPPETDENVGF